MRPTKTYTVLVTLSMLTIGLAAVAIPASADITQAAPSNPADPACVAAHVTGEACQGPNHEPIPGLFGLPSYDPTRVEEGCNIGVWVGEVTCSGIEAADGSGSTGNGAVFAFADAGETASVTVKITDEVTGDVLVEETETSDTIVQTPVGPAAVTAWNCNCFIGNFGDHPITIEATGTHTELGAQTAAYAALDTDYGLGLQPDWVPNNKISITVN